VNCQESWIKILEKIETKGDNFIDSSGKEYLELLNQKISISDVSDYKKPIETMMRKMDFIYPMIDQLENVVLTNKGLKTNFASRMLDFNGKDQLSDYIIPLLKKDRESRRAVMVTYDPEKDSIVDSKTTISLINFFFRIKNNKLYTSVFIRSLDCFVGLPANIVQIATVQQKVCEELKLLPGSITLFAGSAHLYKDNLKLINKVK